ncbi:hypothetical protein HH310_19480 [Actinoplanes sp. TBRC 11911]|uniref:ATP-grasp domain-containing protein n=1 Tax=Actinoplanes sp. TBRC 11911 TaxID=2729386 RepID=UPI00145CA9A5|nr:hypothetical protein [Actinoplanes sp. TBRC 11911]NMO53361.1 hypothetical protein [Actinoplanes sp. TBRC 11911]
MAGTPKLGIVYDLGAARPVDILAAARRVFDPVFVFTRATSAPIPEGSVDVTGLDAATAAGKLTALGVEHITTFSDLQLVATAEIAAAGRMPFLSVATARACRDKLVQRRILADAGVDAVASRLLTRPGDLPALIDEIGLPVVVKPREGRGSIDTQRIDTPGQAREWMRQHATTTTDYVVEEMLVGDPRHAGADWGDFVSVESVIEGGVVRDVGVSGKFPLHPPFREGGLLIPSTVNEDMARRCRHLAEAAVRALGIHMGVTHTEIKLTASGPRIIEVNGRVPGYMPEMIRRATGFDLVKAACKVALGIPVGDLPELPAGVHYQRFIQPPPGATRLVGMADPAVVTAVPGVLRFDPYVTAGSALDWRAGTSDHIGVLHGAAADHRGALAAVTAAIEALALDYS